MPIKQEDKAEYPTGLDLERQNQQCRVVLLEKIRLSSTASSHPSRMFPIDRKGAIYVKPKLVAEIEYRAWKHEGMLRHSSYEGLREVQDNAAVYEIE